MRDPMNLDAELAGMAAGIDWPPTPELSALVARTISARRPANERRWAVAAAAVILALAALLAYPPTRSAIADWLNLHTGINRTNALPSPSPPPPGPLGARLGLGGRTTLDAARTEVTWPVLVPGTLGRPDEVYLQSPPNGPSQGEVTLVYATRPGIPVSGETGVSVLLTEARGRTDTQFFGKMIGPSTTVEEVTVNGHSGWWIAGKPHVFFFDDADGNVRNETMRLATNTLIIDDGGTIIRIEGDLTRELALAIAASLG